MIGDFRNQKPTTAQLEANYRLLQYLQSLLPNMKQILGHQEYPGYSWKACPAIDMDKFRDDYSQFLQKSVKPEDTMPVFIVVNGKKLAVTGILIDGVSMLPVRAVAEAVGVKPVWIAATKDLRVNGKDLNEKKIISGSAYAPARELASVLGLSVEWDGPTKTVYLKGNV